MPRPSWLFRQSGVLALRPAAGGGVEVLLIRSRKDRRWVIPKGVVERDLTPAESAALEAWEEAGIRGRAEADPIGSYVYEKWGGTCTVEVFRFTVTEVADAWPESSRRRLWCNPREAAELVDEPSLSALLRAIPIQPPELP